MVGMSHQTSCHTPIPAAPVRQAEGELQWDNSNGLALLVLGAAAVGQRCAVRCLNHHAVVASPSNVQPFAMLPKVKRAAANLQAPAAAAEQRREQQAGALPEAQLAASARADDAQHGAEASPAKSWQPAAARTLERAPLKTGQPQLALALPAPPEEEGRQQQRAQKGGGQHMTAAATAAALVPAQLPAAPQQGEEEALPQSPGSSTTTIRGSAHQAIPAGLRSPGSMQRPRHSVNSRLGSPAGSSEDEAEAPPRVAGSPLPPLEREAPLSPTSPAQVGGRGSC